MSENYEEMERQYMQMKHNAAITTPEYLALQNQLAALRDERDALKAAVEFYANRNHWMSNVENGDSSLLIAHGKHFDGTSNGWVEADAALARETKP